MYYEFVVYDVLCGRVWDGIYLECVVCGWIFELSTQQEGLSSTESRGLLALWSFSVAVTCVSPLLVILLLTMEFQTSWVYDIPVIFSIGIVQSIAVFPWLSPVLMRLIVTDDG